MHCSLPCVQCIMYCQLYMYAAQYAMDLTLYAIH